MHPACFDTMPPQKAPTLSQGPLQASVTSAVADMAEVLTNARGGLTKNVIIAVPISTGYRAGFADLTPPMAKHNSWAPGVANIDNAFNETVLAKKILSGQA